MLGCRLMPTKKQPSPSTNPTTQSALSLSCWLSAPDGLSLILSTTGSFRVSSIQPDAAPVIAGRPGSRRTLGPFNLLPPTFLWWRDHFCRALHVVMQFGLYHQSA